VLADSPAPPPSDGTTNPGRVPGQPSATSGHAPHAHHGPDTHAAEILVDPRARLDAAVDDIRANAATWVATPIAARLLLLDRLIRDVAAVAPDWIAACVAAEGLDPHAPEAGEEALVGPYLVIRNLRLLHRSLADIARTGRPQIPGPVRLVADGQLGVGVFPGTLLDRLFYPGIRAEVWMEPGVDAAGLPATQATAYRDPGGGQTCLVLGGGNVSSIGPMDVLHRIFVENRVVVLKMHPVNDYLALILERGLAALIERGILRIVRGGSHEGAYLCAHPGIDEIHITGSDRTYEAIVFGSGEQMEQRRERGERITTKRVTAELGNVSPVIVVPGAWSDADLERQAENVATMLTNNAGFNCNAARVLVTSASWAQRAAFLDEIARQLDRIPTRRAWYPGAAARHATFVDRHPAARLSAAVGTGAAATQAADDRLPWALIPDVDPNDDTDPCFTTEAFCGVFAETALPVADPAAFLDAAVRFANDRLWGTLNATILVHPDTERRAGVAAAMDRAIASLRYGTVAVNGWAALGYGLVVTPWGAYPGGDPGDIQSGVGFVHDTLMLSRAQKTVIRAPFRPLLKPVWFAGHRTTHRLAPRLAQFEAARGLAALRMLPAIIGLALVG
jgi:acyl-CoA reductase-like NAD-dependent aldehyde dehydrogenase